MIIGKHVNTPGSILGTGVHCHTVLWEGFDTALWQLSAVEWLFENLEWHDDTEGLAF